MTRRARVLVVDDSAFSRRVLTQVLSAAKDLEVVGAARDGGHALEMIETHDPDVVTLDLMMPGIDGLGVLHALAGRPRPRVLVVSISNVDTELGAEALAAGAIDVIAKPTALATDRLYELSTELVAKTRAAAATFVTELDPRQPPPPPRPSARHVPVELVLVGTSTGGPQALTRLVSALPADLKSPVVMALHIPPGYTEALAQRLDRVSPLTVVEASPGLELKPGMAVLARGGMHVLIEREGAQLFVRLAHQQARPFAPSVDELFTSGAAAVGARALGVVLTGMGDDGLEGARAIAAAGGSLIAESATTSVVYGMPRCVLEAGLGALAVGLDRIAEEIVKRV